MIEHRTFFGVALCAMLLPAAAFANQSPGDSIVLNKLGPENAALKQRIGSWDVTETVWNAPGTSPITTTGLVADRRMMGSMLQELLRPAADASARAVKRIDYLTFNRAEGRWEYVSMDLRAPVGIMTAQSLALGNIDKIEMIFQPFAIAGSGPTVTGQMLRMSEIIIHDRPDRETKLQYFDMANGSGVMWLAHRYSYVRRKR